MRHALQARLYGYNADHPVVILTDFEEFSVYLGRGCEPRASDQVNTALVTTLTCKFTDYLDKWDVIWDAFSRERVMAGSLENLPGVQKASKGSKTVDDLFLADIEQWRQAIATDLHRAHPDISRRALNEATQKPSTASSSCASAKTARLKTMAACSKSAASPASIKTCASYLPRPMRFTTRACSTSRTALTSST